MNTLELKFLNVGKSQHIAYQDPRNPHLRIWYPGCYRITEHITDATDEPTKALCQSCERRIEIETLPKMFTGIEDAG